MLVKSPAVERDALVPAPAGQQHPHPRLRRAALHRFLIHLDVHSGEGAVAAQDREHVADAQRAVAYPQVFLPAHRVDEAVFRRVPGGGRRLAERRQPTERGWRRTPRGRRRLPSIARGSSRNRKRGQHGGQPVRGARFAQVEMESTDRIHREGSPVRGLPAACRGFTACNHAFGPPATDPSTTTSTPHGMMCAATAGRAPRPGRGGLATLAPGAGKHRRW